FSVRVVLPASGWEMIAKVRRGIGPASLGDAWGVTTPQRTNDSCAAPHRPGATVTPGDDGGSPHRRCQADGHDGNRFPCDRPWSARRGGRPRPPGGRADPDALPLP